MNNTTQFLSLSDNVTVNINSIESVRKEGDGAVVRCRSGAEFTVNSYNDVIKLISLYAVVNNIQLLK